MASAICRILGSSAYFVYGLILMHISSKYEEWNRYVLHSEENGGRRCFLLFSLVTSGAFMVPSASGKGKGKNPYDEKRLLEQNKKIQEANKAPEDFPNFIREGFQVKVVTSDKYVKCDSGLIYLDMQVGQGDCPKDGQQVTFHYVGYNESGRRIDSTYLQGTPAKIRLGTKSLVPGFEEGIREMRPGGKRRIIIPPELGPPLFALIMMTAFVSAFNQILLHPADPLMHVILIEYNCGL
ncbi:hypothetical protein ACLOJK_040767 [Asimina triloba]